MNQQLIATGSGGSSTVSKQVKITGYRQLSAEEIQLVNEGKALAEACGAYVQKLRNYVPASCAAVTTDVQAADVSPTDFKPGASIDQRWVSIGGTDLQTGFMALTRSITRPTTF